MTSLTVSDLLAWISAPTNSEVAITAAPDATSTSLLQACLDSAVSNIESYCRLPETYPVAVEQAILMVAARLWDRRKTANGISTGEFGAVRVGSYDADVEMLLAPFKRWSFG